MKRLFCLKAKNGLGRFAPSTLPLYETPPSKIVSCNPFWGNFYLARKPRPNSTPVVTLTLAPILWRARGRQGRSRRSAMCFGDVSPPPKKTTRRIASLDHIDSGVARVYLQGRCCIQGLSAWATIRDMKIAERERGPIATAPLQIAGKVGVDSPRSPSPAPKGRGKTPEPHQHRTRKASPQRYRFMVSVTAG